MPTQEGLFLISSTSDRFAVAYLGSKSPCVIMTQSSDAHSVSDHVDSEVLLARAITHGDLA